MCELGSAPEVAREAAARARLDTPGESVARDRLKEDLLRAETDPLELLDAKKRAAVARAKAAEPRHAPAREAGDAIFLKSAKFHARNRVKQKSRKRDAGAGLS